MIRRCLESFLSCFLFFIVILFVFIPITLAAYTFETWTVEEGLPQNSVLCLLQDKTGYIWLGTQLGLVRFDGMSFRVYNRWNTSCLKGDKITSLYEDSGGALWVGTETTDSSDGADNAGNRNGGLCCQKKQEWTSYSVKEGLSHNSIRAIYGDPEGNVWVGTVNGLSHLAPGHAKFENLTLDDDFWGNTITAIIGGTTVELWIGTDDNGLYYLKNGKCHPYKSMGDSIDNRITTLCQDQYGRLWIGTQNGLFFLENGQTRRPAPPTHFLSNNTIRSLFLDHKGSLWIGTDGDGIFQCQNNVFSTFLLKHELSDNYIYSFLEDRESNMWIGTFTGGLTRIKNARVTSLTTDSGLPQNMIRVLSEDRNGGLWVGMDRQGLAKIIDNKVAGSILPIAGLTAIYQDSNNNLWLGTQQSGIIRYDGGNLHTPAHKYTTKEGLSNNQVTAIRGDKAGNIWIGTANGLNRLTKDKFTIYPGENDKINFPLPVHIKSIEIEENNPTPTTLWLGTTNGLIRLHNDHLGEVLLPGNQGTKLAADIQCLYADSQENLWIGTNGNGLGRLARGNFYLFNTDSGLPNNYIFSILEDKQKNLWMSTYNGVFRISIKQLEDLVQKKIQGLTPLCLGEEDGMISSECVKDGYPSACKTADRKLCFPTVKGVAVIDPDVIKYNDTAPTVIIEDVLINNEPVINRVKPVFPPGKNMLEFYFTALSFTSPGKVKMRYKMEGFDSRWIEVAPRQKRAALYLNMQPGNYRFLVTACNSDGLWNKKEAAFEFKIKYPFPGQSLVYFIIGIFLALSVGTALWLYRKKIQPGVKNKPEEPKYKTSALLPETVEKVLPRLLQLMEKEKIFLKADINLKSLSQRLNVHYNYLSQIINEQLNLNFNDFINSCRIEEAKKKLLDPAEKNKTILDIAYDTGFYSKSVFNTAFKKFTGMTPSEFKRIKRQK